MSFFVFFWDKIDEIKISFNTFLPLKYRISRSYLKIIFKKETKDLI